MRLLNTTTLQLTQFHRDIPPYAILSHTWGDEEVTFQEIDAPEREKKRGWAKVVGCCRQALMDHLDWVWIDTCCIDKTSSAELSEAINSMYGWYENSQICYAFLEDVPAPNPEFPLNEFKAARWFTRGWCLQELIAPRRLEFYAKDWTEIGTKLSLCRWIRKITSIPESVLLDQALWRCSIAQRMSWASQRRTTRVEDEAYCLLGLFQVNMPMLYGEGRRAFSRLQEEIIKRTEDYSFLLWTKHGEINQHRLDEKSTSFPIFATEPACFHRDGLILRERGRIKYHALQSGFSVTYGPWRFLDMDPPQMTSRGLCVSLPRRTVKTPPFDDHKGCLLLWTGLIFDCGAVCVTVVQDTSSWHEQYVRAGDSKPDVHLVELVDLDHFELKQTYLKDPEPSPWFFSRQRLPDFELPKLDVVLSSSSGNTISLGAKASDLPLRFRKVVSHEHRDDAGYTEIWRARDWRWGFWDRSELISFSIRIMIENGSASGDVPQQQAYDLQLNITLERYPQYSTCAFVDDSGSDIGSIELNDVESNCSIEPNDVESNGSSDTETNEFSDRARYRLESGEVVTASIKNSTGQPGLAHFILRAAVLPRQVDRQDDGRRGGREHGS